VQNPIPKKAIPIASIPARWRRNPGQEHWAAEIWLALRTVCRVVGGDAMNPTSTLKIHRPDTSLIEKIKDEIKKSAEAKARRMMLKVPKRLAKR
jgi:hypothetical protein